MRKVGDVTINKHCIFPGKEAPNMMSSRLSLRWWGGGGGLCIVAEKAGRTAATSAKRSPVEISQGWYIFLSSLSDKYDACLHRRSRRFVRSRLARILTTYGYTSSVAVRTVQFDQGGTQNMAVGACCRLLLNTCH